MSIRGLSALLAVIVSCAMPHGLAAETLKIASPIRGLGESMKDAIQFKFLSAPLNETQLKELIQIP